MYEFVQQQQATAEHDAWFRSQVQAGLDSANAGRLVPAADVEAKNSPPAALPRASSLNHPNDGTVLDAGSHSGPRSAIYDYIEADNLMAALALDELFEEKAGQLADHPHLGRRGRVTGTLELVAHQNYILIYDVVGKSVGVLRVLHAARQWPPQSTDKR